MDKPFFVMVYSQTGEFAFPITDSDWGDDLPKFFESADEVRVMMEQHPLRKLGYEIFEMGDGE